MPPDPAEEARALLAKATPGPWEWQVACHWEHDAHTPEPRRVRHISANPDDMTVAIMDSDFTSSDADAALIAAAPRLLAALCEENEQLREVAFAAGAVVFHPAAYEIPYRLQPAQRHMLLDALATIGIHKSVDLAALHPGETDA